MHQSAFGVQTKNRTCRVMTNCAEKTALDKNQVQVEDQTDTNIITPGSLIKPILVSGHK